MQNQSNFQYGFYDRLTAEFPSQIIVDVTEVCNLACSHCPHSEFKKSKYYGAFCLEAELNAKLVDEVKKYGQGCTQYIRYTSNGEPLLHPQIYEMMEYAVRYSGVFVTLTTNGTIMNEIAMKKLLDLGIHMIDISIDAFSEETYSKIRVNGDLSITRKNVLDLIEWVHKSKAKTKVVVSFVEQPCNKHETNVFESFWKEKGADYVVVRRLHSAAGSINNIASGMHSTEEKEKRYPCLYPWERITLNAEGYLSFCPTDWERGATLADYRTTSIKEVWHGKFYEQLRQAHLTNNYSEHSFCGQCPDWQVIRWPGKGRSYADMVQEFKED
jgi:MoaA/NifB/PqqE/SkfB family radical SAM enzyme